MCYLILRPFTSQQYSSKVKYQAKFYSTTVGNGGGGGGGGGEEGGIGGRSVRKEDEPCL